MVRKGWKQVTLGDIALFQGGSQPPLSVFSSQKKAGYIRLVQIRDYKTDKYATYIPEKLAKRFCKQDDIMIGRYGPPIFQILRGIEGAYNVALIKALPQGVDKEFLYHTLKREDLFEYIDLLSRRTSGQTGVDLTNLKAFELSIPVLTDEQATIAKALSDVDSLISSLQKLIEKKKAIKQGAMQELLTGKKRLPGFSGEWSNLRIEEIANLHDNLRVPVEKSMREKGNIPYYGANGIQDYVNGYTHNGSYVLIAEDGANDLQEYPIRYASGKMWVNNHVHVLDGKNSVSDTRFLSYSMSTIDYQAAITGGTRAKLNGHILMQLALDLPPLAEQQAIACFLQALFPQKCRVTSSKMQIDFLKVAWGISPVLHFPFRHSFRCRRGAVAGIQSLLVTDM